MTDADHFSLDVHLQDHRAPNNSPKKREAMGQIFDVFLRLMKSWLSVFIQTMGILQRKLTPAWES